MPLKSLPNTAIEKMELRELRSFVQENALGSLAKQQIINEDILTDAREIRKAYEAVNSWLHLLREDEDLPLQPYDNISSSLDRLKVEGYILEQEEVILIYKQLIISRDLADKSDLLNKEETLALKHIIDHLFVPKDILQACENLFTETFEIRDDASKELLSIQRSIDRTKRTLDRSFNGILKEFGSKGYLSDTAETIRNGRRVLSVKSEYKRQIKGIIHDESSGGRVAYVEPEAILEINNDLFDLKQAKRREILRLLKKLCAIIAAYRQELSANQDWIVQLDVIRAKSLFGKKLDAICPEVTESPNLKIQSGKHPLLMIHYRNKEEKVVPFDLHLHHDNKILVVSGPNAGGKTVLMKSVGLLQLMVQSGIPVPVGEESKFGVFKSLFVDIGDQQSLEDDLSTYSSHLRNMNSFLENADGQTLILIDEFGSGTDPRIGGAIAESILHEFVNTGVHGVVTTHYSNLKNYAHRQKGVVNAAMTFDQEELKPTYELMIGKPGSSFAFELAMKSNLPKRVIKNAKKNAGSALVNIDKMLADIQQQKQSLQHRLTDLEQRERQIDQMRATYEQMRKDIEAQRRRLKMMAKEYDLSKGVEVEKALQEMISEIKESKDLEKARQLAKKEKEKKEQAGRELAELEEQEWKTRQKDEQFKIEEGDFVKVRKTGTVGQVERLKKGKATINTGKFRLEAKLKDLLPANEPLEVNKSKSIQVETDPASQKNIQSKLDIRGLPKNEANRLLDKYFDQAILQGLNRLEIIHGKGSGVLKRLVKEKAHQLAAIESIEHPPAEAGGEGVSLIKL